LASHAFAMRQSDSTVVSEMPMESAISWCVRPPQQLTSAFGFVGFAFDGRFF
jgi:hypothetical protein